MSIATKYKDPAEVLDYQIDWTDDLGTDTITASSWDVPSPLTTPRADTFTPTTTTVWVGGGVTGTMVHATCTITTVDGRTFSRMITFDIKRL